MRLRPACAWCREHFLFVGDCALRIVVRCFAKICEYLASSPIAAILTDVSEGVGERVEAAGRLLAVIHEGVEAGSEPRADGPTDGASVPPTLVSQAAASHDGSTTCVSENGSVQPDNQDDDDGCGVMRVSGNIPEEATVAAVDVTDDDVVPWHDGGPASRDDTDALSARKRKHSLQSDGASCGKSGKVKWAGCRCGQATQHPGMLTCRGQRCPCYSAYRGCVDCHCRGCRNPRGDLQPSRDHDDDDDGHNGRAECQTRA